jgi:hypothetical protein
MAHFWLKICAASGLWAGFHLKQQHATVISVVAHPVLDHEVVDIMEAEV